MKITREKISMSLKILTASVSFLGITISFIFAKVEGYSPWYIRILYFTLQSNLWIGATLLILSLKKQFNFSEKALKIIYFIKYIFTVSITVTFVVFWALLAPFAHRDNYKPWTASSLLTHLFAPIFAIADYFVDTNPIEFRKASVLYSTLPPLFYLIFASVLSVLGVDFGRGQTYPYFFLNYNSPAGLFGLTKEPLALGSAYWILLFLIMVLSFGAFIKALHPSHKDNCKHNFMKENNMIKTVFIDIDNTLLCFNKNATLAISKAFNKHGVGFKDEYMPEFFRINDGLWKRVEKQEITRQDIFEIRFKNVLTELGLNEHVHKAKDIEKDFRAELFVLAETVDGAKDLLAYLSRKYKIYAASNAIHDQQINRLKLAGLYEYFSGVFVSEEIGFNKPTKEFFNACFKKANATAENSVMIGDSLTADIIGAKNVGMKTVWYNHNKVCRPQEKLYDYYVASLIEIKNIL